MKYAKRMLAVTAATLAGAMLLGGCSNGGSDNVGGSNIDVSFPLEKPVEFTYWMPLDTNVSKVTNTMGDTELYKELEERTGVKLKFLHPPLGQHTEQFNLMIASNEYPDIFEYDMKLYQGGPQKALDDEIIISLNDGMEKYAPNLTALLKNNAEWDKNVKTDEGDYFTFPFIRGDDLLRVYAGPMVRKDWLKELNLAEPETLDEWETMLAAFKEKKGATNPLSFELKAFKTHNLIAGAFGVSNDMFINRAGEVAYGPVEPEYKEFLAKLKDWYDKGLLDRDFATNDNALVRTKMSTDKAGVTTGGTGGTMGTLMSLMKNQNPAFELEPLPYPTRNKGEKPLLGQLDPSSGQNAFISTACKNPEIAMKFLDYGYGQDGNLLYNYGIEGKSYTVTDGKPTYTDEILKNPNGLSIASAMGSYLRASYNGPFVQDYGYIEQYCTLPQQRDAIKLWAETDAKEHVLPLAATPNSEETTRYAQIMADVKTYCEEMFLKFVLGSESLDNFDSYVANVKKMGIDEAVTIQKAALERYNNR